MREQTTRQTRIGGRLRRLRQDKKLTQAQMAVALGISPSYLNLLESNQRPVTVNVLLRLADKFQMDLSALVGEDEERLASDLMEALSDPLFDGQDLKASDARDLAANLPAVARALLSVYQAYRRGAPAPEPADALEIEAPFAGAPSEEVSEFLQARLNHFPPLEEAAEGLWLEHGLALLSLQQDLVKALAQRFGVDVEIAPAEAMPGLLRHYNPMNRRLMLSEMLPGPSRTFQLAHQIAFLGARREIEALVSGGKFTSAEADALANYFAGAVMAPYARFHAAAKAARYDVDVLRNRFGLSFEQTCHRLTTLRRPGQEGVPFHLTRVDIAGNISKRFSASGIHIARFGAACPRWNVYDAFATPGMLRVQVSQMPDGERYFCIAKTIEAPAAQPRGGLLHRTSKLAIGLGCHVSHARKLVYSDGVPLDDAALTTPIGVSCRSCPRRNCSDRAMPALAQRLEIDENKRGMSTYATSE
jgi:predicted transcriptional regulator/DNA-binding XRE family transcriptional regulator